MLEVTFLLAANLDAQRVYQAFEDFREGRGDYFSDRLEAALEMLKSFPEIGPLYEENFRRLLVKGVNFAIFYTIEGRRDPYPASFGIAAGSSCHSPQTSRGRFLIFYNVACVPIVCLRNCPHAAAMS